MDPRRLELLLQLSRLGSMREVAETMRVTTSTVSQQIAQLAREVGTPLLEHEGRRVRLTPAGRRLADHAVTVLAALEAARADLDPDAEPAGTLRAASFATAIRQALLPVVRTLARDHPAVSLLIDEHEPAEALARLAADDVDLALTYDYDLAPVTFAPTMLSAPLGRTPWWLGVPASGQAQDGSPPATSLDAVRRFAGHDWIVNSRNTADEDVVRTLSALAGVEPRVTHRADSLDLVQDMVLAGLGVALLPAEQPVREGVALLPLREPEVWLRAYSVVRSGREAWPPLALVLRLLSGVELV